MHKRGNINHKYSSAGMSGMLPFEKYWFRIGIVWTTEWKSIYEIIKKELMLILLTAKLFWSVLICDTNSISLLCSTQLICLSVGSYEFKLQWCFYFKSMVNQGFHLFSHFLISNTSFTSGNFHWTPEDVAKSIVCMIMSGPCLTGYTQVWFFALPFEAPR